MLAGAPARLPGCTPTCSTQGGLFLRRCQRLAGRPSSRSSEEAGWLCSAFRGLLMSLSSFSEPLLTPENRQRMPFGFPRGFGGPARIAQVLSLIPVGRLKCLF